MYVTTTFKVKSSKQAKQITANREVTPTSDFLHRHSISQGLQGIFYHEEKKKGS
jgi:hypothetical protein